MYGSREWLVAGVPEQPWLLVTNLADPSLVERLYRRRMRIEHGFRHWKHHLKLRLPERRIVHSACRFGRLITWWWPTGGRC